MKKLIILMMVSTITLGAFSQTTKDTSMSKMHHMMKDCVMMKDGKAKIWKNGTASMVTDPVKLNNGATVMADGTIKNADGSTTMLTNGEYIDMDGKIGTMHNKMKKDSM